MAAISGVGQAPPDAGALKAEDRGPPGTRSFLYLLFAYPSPDLIKPELKGKLDVESEDALSSHIMVWGAFAVIIIMVALRWFWIPVILTVLFLGEYLGKLYTMFKQHRAAFGETAAPFFLVIVRLTALAIACLLWYAAYNYGYFRFYTNPATSVSGIPVEQLTRYVRTHPHLRNIRLADGFVAASRTGSHVDCQLMGGEPGGSGHMQEICTTFLAAPIYVTEAVAGGSGPPAAWAAMYLDGMVPDMRLEPALCDEGSPCGRLLIGELKRPSNRSPHCQCPNYQCDYNSCVGNAVQKAAKEFGFEFAENLPVIIMDNIDVAVHKYSWWADRFSEYRWWTALLVFAVLGMSDSLMDPDRLSLRDSCIEEKIRPSSGERQPLIA